METKALKDFLNLMSDNIEADKIKLFEKIIDSSELTNFENPDEFYYAVLYSWDKFIGGFLKSTISTNKDIEFIFKNSRYINRHFRNLFEKYEGSFACADKSNTIIKRLIKFYTTGDRIEFNYEGEYTYHLPTRIFKTHEHIVDFYLGLRDFYYGNPQRYVEALKIVIVDVVGVEQNNN